MTSDGDGENDKYVCSDCGKEFKYDRIYEKHQYRCDGTRTVNSNSKNSYVNDNGTISSTIEISPCPMTEYYESIRSIRDALEKIEPTVENEKIRTPKDQYYQVIRSIIQTGHPESESIPGYGSQQADRVQHQAKEYRLDYGNGDWITDYPAIDSKSPDAEFFSRYATNISKKDIYIQQPIPPTESTPIPVVVDSREELGKALWLLSQLPAHPPITTNKAPDSTQLPIYQIYTTKIAGTDIDPVDFEPPKKGQKSNHNSSEEESGSSSDNRNQAHSDDNHWKISELAQATKLDEEQLQSGIDRLRSLGCTHSDAVELYRRYMRDMLLGKGFFAVSGVGPESGWKLIQAGVSSVQELSSIDPSNISSKTVLTKDRLERLKKAAKSEDFRSLDPVDADVARDVWETPKSLSIGTEHHEEFDYVSSSTSTQDGSPIQDDSGSKNVGVTIIHTTDTYLDRRNLRSSSRRDDFLSALDQVVETAIQQDANSIFHSGNLFWSQSPGQYIKKGCKDILRKATDHDVSFYLIPGGRDTERTPEVINDLETEGLLTKLESGWHRVDWMDIFSYTYDCDMNLGYYSRQKVSDSTIKIAIINDDSQVPNKRKQFDQLEDKLGVNINLLLAGHSKKPVKRSFGDKLVLSPGTPERILSKSSISDPPQDPVLFEYTIDHSGINITSHNIEARRCIGLKVQLSADDSKDELISNFPDDVPDNVVALIEIEGETSDVGLTKKQIQNVIEQKVAIARVYDERKDTGYSIHTETPKYTKVTDTGVPENKNTIKYDDSISIKDCSLAKQRPSSKQRVDQQNEKTSSEKSKNSQNEKRDTDQSKSSTNESTFTKEKTFTLENPPTPDELPLPKKPDQKANDSEPYPNYLTEYYESFRNAKNLLSIIFQLEGIGINPEDLTDPSVQYYTLLDALISFADTSVLFNGYGPQHQDRIPFSVDSYCEKYGNGDTITDYQVINVEPFSDKTLNIVSEAIGGQELDYVRPCVPGTDVPMPALPDSREELSQAMSLLSIFPAYPPLQTESGVNDRTVPIGEIYQSRFSELDSRHKCDVSHYDSAQPILSESPVPEATPTSENEAESKLVDYGRLSHLFQRITPPNESPMNRSLGVFSLNWYKPNNQSYDALRALAYDNEDVAEAFKPRIRDLIHRRFLLDNWEYDYITVLPSHEENTLNPQLVQLAKDAVLETNIIYTPLLRRTNTAEPQRNKSKVERQEIAKNPSKTLQAQSRLNNDNVLLLDDICTTGSSLIAGSHLLQEAGASRVIGITFGLTPGDSQDFVTEISDPKAVASEIIAGGGR